MHKDDLAQAILGSNDAIGESIVNPRCDECRTSLPTPKPHEIGMPRLCAICEVVAGREYETLAKDWVSQERPRGRKVHVVKLPDGMKDKRNV
jgi:hypothetical protein